MKFHILIVFHFIFGFWISSIINNFIKYLKCRLLKINIEFLIVN